MARRPLGACCVLLAAVLLVAVASARADGEPSGECRGRKVGARTEVRDVERDGEVQELGRFSVAEYNRRRVGGERLEFGLVVAAQRQVVSGLKYYLRVAAAAENAGGERVFDAVVVVKPWLESRTLLRFAPAAPK
ncbi:cysteine proteinase inhibitor 4-like [Panicum miliaceum]|uniref:Cysteine proteinase inhibitor 4-like n=1 Tax=Panicum miliaceum TaxID=4540 RepID=A0A3L6SNW1_PANMI|nr:cysteine proteinase inhibitor 4-like [Panicum miliaceum]